MDEADRQYIRLSVRLLTWVKSLDSGKVQRSLTQDVGGGGLSLITDETIAPGTRLALEIQLPDRVEPIRCMAEVIRSELQQDSGTPTRHPTAETGVKFVEINPKDRAFIVQFAQLNSMPL